MLGKGLESLIPPQDNLGAKKDEGTTPQPQTDAPSDPVGVTPSTPPESAKPHEYSAEVPVSRPSPKKSNESESVFHIEVEKIRPNPYQPRRIFDETALKELASSIRDFGFLQPIVVSKIERETPVGVEVEYELIAGERRWLAAKMLGLERVPAIVRNVERDRERLEMAIIENLQRENLNPIEIGRALARLQDEFRLTQREIASQLGKSREAVANTVRLLDLPPKVQEALAEGKITETHGRLLLAVSDPAAQNKIFEDLLATRFTTRELKERVKATQPRKERGADIPPELKGFQDRLSGELGTHVTIEKHGDTGKISISFYSGEELEHLVRRIAGKDAEP